ncbi:MAG: mandelate racemase/muconate lactonizing enzyme family protein [Planctomycetes bacterium]|nr:mandelate racemase/muconate lactonizing enzyme family protein [Planctomycetota bacterium]
MSIRLSVEHSGFHLCWPRESAWAAVTRQAARADIDDLRVTGMGFLRLRFPGKTPRKRNAIIVSGGGTPGMAQLEIQTNQGLVGRSMPSGSKLIESVFSKVKGENPFHVERIWDRMYRYNRKPVAKGDYIAAMGSLDMAIWDLIGKALGLPVYKVLGVHNKKIRVYAAGGYYRDDKTIDDLLIDANNKWHAYEAIRFGRAVERFNPFWFEEPVEPDDFAGCAEVKQALDMPIVAGENEFTRWGCRDLIEAGSADILNLDTVKAGGITEYRKIAALALLVFHKNPYLFPQVVNRIVEFLVNAIGQTGDARKP